MPPPTEFPSRNFRTILRTSFRCVRRAVARFSVGFAKPAGGLSCGLVLALTLLPAAIGPGSQAYAETGAGTVTAEVAPMPNVKRPDAPDALTGATLAMPAPDVKTLRVAIVAYVRPSPFEAIVEPTVEALRRQFGENVLEIRRYTLSQLAEAVEKREVDIFLSSSGFFLRMIPTGVRSLATVVSEDYPDPNHNDGSTLVVLNERDDLRTLADLQGTSLATSTRLGFTGRLVPMGEIYRAGFDPEHFFSQTLYLGGGTRVHEALDLLRRKSVDVANLRLCFIEEWLADHPEDTGRFRVINRKDTSVPGKPEACARSTDLYPSWTIATTAATDPNVSRLVTRVLLEMPPQGEKNLYWGVATDFGSIDRLFRDLKTGPYAYLRDWTVKRFLSEYREAIVLVVLLALGLVGHSVRVSQLVRRRTRLLVEALDTQERLKNEARDAGERLERLERIGVVGQLSTIFAHEMRQPLAAISLYSLGLRKIAQNAENSENGGNAGGVPAAKIIDVLEKLDRQTARADAIVTRVRSYAKRRGACRQAVALKDVVRSAVADLTVTGRWKSEIVATPLEDVTIEADPFEMELVAVNLIKNALESLEVQVTDGRFPSKATPTVTVAVVATETQALLIVSDNGRPIEEDLLRRLAESAPSTKEEGLGLGLSIVRGIVESHAGRLTFERGGTGSLSARVAIPVAKTSQPSESAESSEPSDPTEAG